MNPGNKNKLFSIVIILLLLLNTAVVVFLLLKKDKHRPPPHKKEQAGGAFEFLVKELQLDSAQIAKYTTLKDEHHEKADSLSEEKRRMKDLFFGLMKTKEFPDEEVQKKLDTIAIIDRTLDKVTFAHFKKLRAICNSQQQLKFDSIIMDVLHSQKPPRPEEHENHPPPHHNMDGDGPPPPPQHERGE